MAVERYLVEPTFEIAKTDCKPLKINADLAPALRRVEVLTRRDMVENLLPDWQQLVEADQNRHSAFLAPHWVLSWLGNADPVFVCVWEDDALVALMPMAKSGAAFGSASILQLATDDSSTYGVPLLALRDHTKYVAIILQKICDEEIADIIQLGRVYSDISVFADTFGQLPSEAGYASALNLSKDLENVGVRRSIYLRTKKEARQKLRKLKPGDTLEFAFLTGDSGRARDLVNLGLKWKQERLKRLGRIGQNISSSSYQRKLKQVYAGSSLAEDVSVLFYLLLNGTPVAMSLHLRDDEALYSHFSAFDPAFGYFSPGTVLFGHVLDWMKDNHVMRYDFMGYPEDYKARFSNETVSLNDYMLPLTGRGRWASRLMRMPLKPMVKSAFYALPLPLRRLVVEMV